MKSKLKKIISNLNPHLFDVENLIIDSFKKLGVGEGNINYVFMVAGQKYICRVNIELTKSNKTKQEFDTLKKIEKHNFSPKPIYFNKNPEFSIIKFIEGKSFRYGKRTYTQKQIKDIAKTLAELHSIKTHIEPKNYNFGYYTTGAKHLITHLNKRTNNRFKKELELMFKYIITLIPQKEVHKYSLIHGDVCPQNIVETKKRIKFIDWENVEVSDPAKDIAQVIINMGFKGANRDLFKRTYFSMRKDASLFERAKIYVILMKQNYYIWEFIRALEIKNKELPKDYLQKTSVKEHLNKANRQFNQLKKLTHLDHIQINFFS